MTEDDGLRTNRLRLLAEVRDTVGLLGDVEDAPVRRPGPAPVGSDERLLPVRLPARGLVDLAGIAAAVDPAAARRRPVRTCDEYNASLAPLKSFVLPGGDEVAARLQLARTICRRAERRAVALAETTQINSAALAYLNRLSDVLFILARSTVGRAETLWAPGATLTQ